MSPLQFNIVQISKIKFKQLNQLWHSRLPICSNCFGGICFGAEYKNTLFAVAWWSLPIAFNRMNNGKRILELRRLAISSDAPKNTASRMLKIMVLLIKKMRRDVFKLISYQDTEVHNGIIYKASGWEIGTVSKFKSWTQRTDDKKYNWISDTQSMADKIRWEKQIRPEPEIVIKPKIKQETKQLKLWN